MGRVRVATFAFTVSLLFPGRGERRREEGNGGLAATVEQGAVRSKKKRQQKRNLADDDDDESVFATQTEIFQALPEQIPTDDATVHAGSSAEEPQKKRPRSKWVPFGAKESVNRSSTPQQMMTMPCWTPPSSLSSVSAMKLSRLLR